MVINEHKNRPNQQVKCVLDGQRTNELTCKVVVRKLFLDTISTKKSSGTSLSWKWIHERNPLNRFTCLTKESSL